jgi:hypothetical protein
LGHNAFSPDPRIFSAIFLLFFFVFEAGWGLRSSGTLAPTIGKKLTRAGWPASPRPPAADKQPESARLEVSESSSSLTGESDTGESDTDATDADASVLANPYRAKPHDFWYIRRAWGGVQSSA